MPSINLVDFSLTFQSENNCDFSLKIQPRTEIVEKEVLILDPLPCLFCVSSFSFLFSQPENPFSFTFFSFLFFSFLFFSFLLSFFIFVCCFKSNQIKSNQTKSNKIKNQKSKIKNQKSNQKIKKSKNQKNHSKVEKDRNEGGGKNHSTHNILVLKQKPFI